MCKRIINTGIAFVFIATLAMSSCKKFLAVEVPNSKIPTELLFADDATANTALAGVYLDMYSINGSFAGGGAGSMAWLTGLMADELHNVPQDSPPIVDFEQNTIKPDNIYVSNIWTSIYKTIYNVNAILEELELSTGVTPAKKDQFRGEALFVRALCHFYLVNMFGDAPLVTTTNYKINAKVSRTPQEQVYTQVETDLLEAESLFPEYDPSLERVRPSKSAATALLARFYLYRKNWLKAEENASKIISKATVYTLPDNLNNVFLNTSSEAIWQLKPTDKAFATNEGMAFNIIQIAQGNVLTDTIVNSFQSIDLRKSDWITKEGVFTLPQKYKLYMGSGPPSTEYSMVFRLAEQFLIRAEARAQLDIISGTNSAISDINKVRHRAGLNDTSAADLPELMHILERERKLELFSEWGHRWFDLKRWNKSTLVLAPLKSGWAVTDTILPIPQSELNKNPYLKRQNPGYN